MDKKIKKKLETLKKKVQLLRQQLAGARRQTDDPGEVERIAADLARTESEIAKLTAR